MTTPKKAQSFIYRVMESHPLSDTILQLCLMPEKKTHPLFYEAGQYLEIITSDGVARPFSIANAPLGSFQIECHIRHTKENTFATQLLKDIRTQGKLALSGPYGQCTLKSVAETEKHPLIFVAFGTGFAPMKALLEDCLAKGITSNMHLYWAAPSFSDIYLDELPRKWQHHVDHFFYQTVCVAKSTPLELLEAIVATIKKEQQDLTHALVFAAGAFDVMFALKEALLPLGLNPANIISDAFFR